MLLGAVKRRSTVHKLTRIRFFAACLPVCALLLASPVSAGAEPQGNGGAASVSSPVSEPQPAGAADPSAVKAPAAPHFTPPVAMVRHLAKKTELPALQLSLALVNFVGETDTENMAPNEEAYAILPLSTESILEVYDLENKNGRLELSESPTVRRFMNANEAYVLRVPSGDGLPTETVCVTARGEKHCWNPGDDMLGGDFIRWSATKGLK